MPKRKSHKQPRAAFVTEGLAGEIAAVYNGSDGDATSAMYRRLERLGPRGVVAVNVFRAQKASERAKAYRGGNGQQSYREMAYSRKQWSIENLCKALTIHAEALQVSWGWAMDPPRTPHHHVLYVELPTGQVSWHTDAKGVGPDYKKPWDRSIGMAPNRICQWIASVLEPENV